jgi:hypothetical protein
MTWAWLAGVRAVAAIAGQVRRQDLAGRLGRDRTAVVVDDEPAVQGQVDGLADAHVVERRRADVEEHEPGDQYRIDPDLAVVLCEVPGAARVPPEVGHEVGLAPGNRGGACGGAEVEADADLVGVPGRLGRGAPFPPAIRRRSASLEASRPACAGGSRGALSCGCACNE